MNLDKLQALMKRYGEQCEEWRAIADELIARARNDGTTVVTAYEVTLEQRRRLFARGDRMVTYEELLET